MTCSQRPQSYWTRVEYLGLIVPMVNILHPGTGPVQSVLFGKRWPTNLDGSAIDLIPAVHLTVIQSYTSYNWLMVSLSLSFSLFVLCATSFFLLRCFSYSAVFPTPLHSLAFDSKSQVVFIRRSRLPIGHDLPISAVQDVAKR